MAGKLDTKRGNVVFGASSSVESSAKRKRGRPRKDECIPKKEVKQELPDQAFPVKEEPQEERGPIAPKKEAQETLDPNVSKTKELLELLAVPRKEEPLEALHAIVPKKEEPEEALDATVPKTRELLELLDVPKKKEPEEDPETFTFEILDTFPGGYHVTAKVGLYETPMRGVLFQPGVSNPWFWNNISAPVSAPSVSPPWAPLPPANGVFVGNFPGGYHVTAKVGLDETPMRGVLFQPGVSNPWFWNDINAPVSAPSVSPPWAPLPPANGLFFAREWHYSNPGPSALPTVVRIKKEISQTSCLTVRTLVQIKKEESLNSCPAVGTPVQIKKEEVSQDSCPAVRTPVQIKKEES